MLRGKKLGEGTFGLVYSASSPSSDKSYAVKRNLTEQDTSFIGVARELDVLNRVRHHCHIVKLEEVSFGEPFTNKLFSPLKGDRSTQRDDTLHFMFKEASYDLHNFIYGATEINFSITRMYMINILLGLEYLHSQKIIHRDIKPSNVLVFGSEKDALGCRNVAKICDFGLAKPFTRQVDNTPNTVTSVYRPPEVCMNVPDYDYRVDIWSLGCVFFEMIAKRTFVKQIEDEDSVILSSILEITPEQIPVRYIREKIMNNKWKKMKIKNRYNKSKSSFRELFRLSDEGLRSFERDCGSMDSFSDLLSCMLQFDHSKRYTASQCIDHPFFSRDRELIDATRECCPLDAPIPQSITIHQCVERNWMTDIARDIFHKKNTLDWYSDRILFQAMDIFDRYLTTMGSRDVDVGDDIESEYKGLIHDRFDAELRFYTCIYLCIKYFSSIHSPLTFECVVPPRYSTKTALMIAEQYESALIKNCLSYEIYRDTLFEYADDHCDRLSLSQLEELFERYCSCPSGVMTHRDIAASYFGEQCLL